MDEMRLTTFEELMEYIYKIRAELSDKTSLSNSLIDENIKLRKEIAALKEAN